MCGVEFEGPWNVDAGKIGPLVLPGAVTCFPRRVKTVITHPSSKQAVLCVTSPGGPHSTFPLLTKLLLAAGRVWLESPSQTEPRGTWLGNCKLAFWLLSL